jgi:2-dehydropantoate 2-reductase
MKTVLVYGAGGVGGYYGGKLLAGRPSPSPWSLSFVARGEHGRIIAEKGLLLKEEGGTETLCRPDAVYRETDDIPAPDLVLVCVKSYDLDRVCDRLEALIGHHTLVLPLLNGIDIRERIRGRLKKGILLQGCTYVGTHIEKPGVIKQGGKRGRILWGPDPDNRGADTAWFRDLLGTASVDTECLEDPRPAIWEKYLFIAAYGMTGAAFNKTVGQVYADPALKQTARGVMEETRLLAECSGVTLSESVIEASLNKAVLFPCETKCSFHRDFEIPGRPDERDIFGKTLVRLGRQFGVPVPVSEDLTHRLDSLKSL